MSTLPIQTYTDTNPGCVRPHNEDSWVCCGPDETGDHGWLFVVSDGMGGAAAGEIASYTVSDTVKSRYPALRQQGMPAIEALDTVIREAHARILGFVEQDPTKRGMGTTCVALIVEGEVAIGAHVGDSRLYGLDEGGRVHKLTKDHSRLQQLVDAGLLTAEQAAEHPDSNVIVRALGRGEAPLDFGRAEWFSAASRTFLLCSDGLHGVISDPVIELAMRSLAVEEATKALIVLAREQGAPDNVTVCLVRNGMPVAPMSVERFLAQARTMLKPKPAEVHVGPAAPAQAAVAAPSSGRGRRFGGLDPRVFVASAVVGGGLVAAVVLSGVWGTNAADEGNGDGVPVDGSSSHESAGSSGSGGDGEGSGSGAHKPDHATQQIDQLPLEQGRPPSGNRVVPVGAPQAEPERPADAGARATEASGEGSE